MVSCLPLISVIVIMLPLLVGLALVRFYADDHMEGVLFSGHIVCMDAC